MTNQSLTFAKGKTTKTAKQMGFSVTHKQVEDVLDSSNDTGNPFLKNNSAAITVTNEQSKSKAENKRSGKIIPHSKLQSRYMGTRYSHANVTMNTFAMSSKQSISNERNAHQNRSNNQTNQNNKAMMTERLRNLYVNQYNKNSSRDHNMTTSNNFSNKAENTQMLASQSYSNCMNQTNTLKRRNGSHIPTSVGSANTTVVHRHHRTKSQTSSNNHSVEKHTIINKTKKVDEKVIFEGEVRKINDVFQNRVRRHMNKTVQTCDQKDKLDTQCIVEYQKDIMSHYLKTETDN
jgi:hypothetical protein